VEHEWEVLEIIGFVGQRNWMQQKIIHRSWISTQLKRLVGRP